VPGQVDWKALAGDLDGTLLGPGRRAIGTAVRLYNPRFDKLEPLVVVQAASADDIVTTVKFAARSGLHLQARSGGHSYVGASAAQGAIQLDVRRLSSLRYDAASKTMTVGAGAGILPVHAALDPHGRTIPTGTCATVGAAGLTLGGGLGVEDRAFGLTCDALESVTIVTPDGALVTADVDRHPDLLWACRGGGGGNFGVVTKFRYRTFPAYSMSTFYLRWDEAATERVIKGWQRRARVQSKTSWSNLHLDASSGRVVPAVFGVSFDGQGPAESAAVVAAIGVEPAGHVLSTRPHLSGVLALAGCSDRTVEQCRLPPHGTLPREISVAGSDVLGTALAPASVRRLAQLMRARAAAGLPASVIVDPLGGRIAEGSAAGSAFPWRDAFATVQWYVGMPTVPTAAAVASTYDWIDQGHRAVAASAVGAYVNYLEPGRPVSSYYGKSYPRLRRLRRRYDPDRLFRGAYAIPF
jgi:FAD/FMN-containing dehydrogenase